MLTAGFRNMAVPSHCCWQEISARHWCAAQELIWSSLLQLKGTCSEPHYEEKTESFFFYHFWQFYCSWCGTLIGSCNFLSHPTQMKPQRTFNQADYIFLQMLDLKHFSFTGSITPLKAHLCFIFVRFPSAPNMIYVTIPHTSAVMWFFLFVMVPWTGNIIWTFIISQRCSSKHPAMF